jgi:hypothetical protein
MNRNKVIPGTRWERRVFHIQGKLAAWLENWCNSVRASRCRVVQDVLTSMRNRGNLVVSKLGRLRPIHKHPRRRVCVYLERDLLTWLATTSRVLGISQARVVETEIIALRHREDPDGTIPDYFDESHPPARRPKAPAPTPAEVLKQRASARQASFNRLNGFREWRSPQPSFQWVPTKPGYNDWGEKMPI